MIVDSCFLIDVIRQDKKALHLLDLTANITLKTTSISVFEILNGTKSKKTTEKIASILKSMEIFAFDAEAAELASHIFRNLRAKGLEIDMPDCMIAGIALKENIPVITRNKKHFGRIEGLQILGY